MTSVTAPVGAEPASEVIDWLLDDRWPAVRRLTLLELLDRSPDDATVAEITATLAEDSWVRPLLSGKADDGASQAVAHAYAKWTGAHWRLFALAELGVSIDTPGAEGPIRDALELELAWLGSPGRRRRLGQPIRGRVRNCSSQEGAGLWAAVRLGLGEDPRLRAVAERLIEIQWPDGGWNCDIRPGASHSSFNESWMPLRSLVAARAIDAVASIPGLEAAIERSAEFFLRHRVAESERTGELANDHITWLRWPPYWHYALLPGLRAIADAGLLGDPRAQAGLERLAAARSEDGRWWPDGRYWKGPGSTGSGVELVRWGREGEARMLTLQALHLLHDAARLA